MSAIGHVLFDLDGTLIDSSSDLVAAVNHVRAEFDLPALEPDTVCRYVGDGARALVQRALGPHREDDSARGVQMFLAYYCEHLLDATRFYPGIRELLADLAAAGVSASVLTNKPEVLSRRILEGLAAAEGFVDVVGGDTLGVKKPHADGVYRLLERAGVRAERALLVGDSLVDLATARASGVAFCGVAWGFSPEGLAAAGVPLVASAPTLAEAVLRSW